MKITETDRGNIKIVMSKEEASDFYQYLISPYKEDDYIPVWDLMVSNKYLYL